MARYDTRHTAYFADDARAVKKHGDNMGNILDALGRQMVKEKTPSLEDLECVLQESSVGSQGGKAIPRPMTKLLQERGYAKDGKRWLTDKAFFELGIRMLQDVFRNLNAHERGAHETGLYGPGSVTSDSTVHMKENSDISNVSVPATLLNAVLRQKAVSFPVRLKPSDIEEFETYRDTKTAVSYCIDQSSTMRYRLAGGASRISAAKKALWSLYVLNRRFFPGDEVFIIGFASLASEIGPGDIPYLGTYDARDDFLHYTNYQAALRLARRHLLRSDARNKRIVLITDGQPSACFVDNETQRNEIVSEKPYSNFYAPDEKLLSRIQNEKSVNLGQNRGKTVYLCYRHKKVDKRISQATLREAKQCLRRGIRIDSIVVSDEDELLEYIRGLESALDGRMYHVKNSRMDRIMIADYLRGTKKILSRANTI